MDQPAARNEDIILTRHDPMDLRVDSVIAVGTFMIG